jgi:hypothetical protein
LRGKKLWKLQYNGLFFGMLESLSSFFSQGCHVFRGVFMLGLGLALGAPGARAVLFENSGDPGFNTTAPTGLFESAGWPYLGYYGAFLGTAISPQHFITSQHFGLQGGVFSQDALFTGGATVNQTIDSTVNGGLGYWDIAGSDLRIFKIEGTFASYAELYLGSGLGETAVLTGRGGVRGDAVVGMGVQGWQHTTPDSVARWGTNEISGAVGSGAGTLWVARFDGTGGTPFEAGLSSGDSGGGLFINQGGEWKLAGVNYSIDGLFDTNNTVGDNSEFSASMTNMRGFYQGSDSGGWSLIPTGGNALPSGMYFSSVTANVAAIQTIIAVPEPSGALLVAVALMGGGFFRRRQKSPCHP